MNKDSFNNIFVFLTLIIIIIFLLTVFSGCTDQYKEGTGTIQYNDFEGGFYGILGDDGEKYNPINLPIEFKEDGIRVKYNLNTLENQSSIQMWGTIVEIIEIEKL